ncbi:MAG: hypothetical protein GEV12_09185 [Micromonosporaceae bacterium]|nr:hypothetical protein [Micromonosporaceae bacterium]
MSPVRAATRPTPSARANRTREPDVSRFHAATFMIMVCGSTLALLLVAGGLVMLDPQAMRAATGGSASAAPDEDEPESADSSADLAVSAEHLGDLRVGIEVRVTMNEQQRPLQRATVEATLDMVQMPGSHTLGPLELSADDGEPGLYTTTTTVPMLGEYEIQVHMNEPVNAEASYRLAVDVLESDG